MTAQPPLLELHGIAKRFGASRALAGVHFSLQRGEIHALCGENGAGKSTLMKIIDGIHAPDEGDIRLNGERVVIDGPAHAMRLGIGLVHQEIALCGDATVAENIFMPEITTRPRAWMDFASLNARAAQVLARLGQQIDPGLRVDDLGISSQQLVEIAKALTLDCKVLILDEPTAALTEVESAALFRVLHDLKAQGIGIIYISHRMAEIFQHCDRVTVLRDGRDVLCAPLSGLTPDALVRSMVGRDLGCYYPPKQAAGGNAAPLLEVDGIADDVSVHGISFTLKRGEILGISGLMGAGRSELAETLCGLRRARRGSVRLRGEPLRIRRYGDALRHGIAYLSEDRKAAGLFLELPIEQNISSMALARISSRFGLLRRRAERRLATELGARLKLKSDGVAIDAASLSGGNQQKVAIAKLLATNPAVLLMDEPTRGVDVGAKSEIHHILRDLASQGVGVVVISSELPEIIGLCDRALVIRDGRLAGELAASEMTEERLLRLASGLSAQETI
ncbi:D-xylose ABC transporter ATP-binding protein [Achromobacter marplatensis]|uniref:Monosaccharide ABC transporter ATP-binding protein (CUT2 family) n=1 Tax=Achromobacter marplatensis TaxID=470868 RepID=A0ABX9GJN4_9BURK|nr:sugar ABC transporter ATP-binding protein [Achromobacter marplatensis]OWT72013.1 D-xylose ABC transporter ATP-binding protein [Achromobacter marplatensis]RBP24723.1 monosaccharide ABC transporter ATP-binding protein (CUT2 family) [Achromobacter marplatensis]CAB3624849.1 Ribose import ATP-binding protein RbsA [Achromobacter marplatensis]